TPEMVVHVLGESWASRTRQASAERRSGTLPGWEGEGNPPSGNLLVLLSQPAGPETVSSLRVGTRRVRMGRNAAIARALGVTGAGAAGPCHWTAETAGLRLGSLARRRRSTRGGALRVALHDRGVVGRSGVGADAACWFRLWGRARVCDRVARRQSRCLDQLRRCPGVGQTLG